MSVALELSKLTVRRFLLVREKDHTGRSGVGHVAEGVVFSDGTVVLRWTSQTRTTGIYSSIDDVTRIHGHEGWTAIDWIDEGLQAVPEPRPVLCPSGCDLTALTGVECAHGYRFEPLTPSLIYGKRPRPPVKPAESLPTLADPALVAAPAKPVGPGWRFWRRTRGAA